MGENVSGTREILVLTYSVHGNTLALAREIARDVERLGGGASHWPGSESDHALDDNEIRLARVLGRRVAETAAKP